MDFITTARAEFARLHDETAAAIEAAKDREYTAEEKTAQDARFARMDVLKAKLDEAAKFAKLAYEKGDVILPKSAPGKDEYEAHRNGNVEVKPDKIDRAEFAKAVTEWAGTGNIARRFATITTATQSGIFLPREVAAPIVPTYANSIRQAINIQGMDTVTLVTTPTTAALNVPVITGTAGGVVAENASSETDGTPGLTESINLNVQTYQSGSVYFSNQQLAAGTVDVIGAVVPTLSYEKELGLESAIVAGMVADSGITQVVTSASATAFTYANLVSLNRKLPKRFDAKKVILLSDDAYAAAEQLTGSDGQPVLNRDTQNQELLRFNGTPVIRCSYLGAMTTGQTVGLVISLLGFRLRDVSGSNLARYDQVPAKPNQIGFNLFSYHGYGYAPSAVAKLKTA